MDRLTLSYSRDTDGTGELTANINACGFAGSGSAWFDDRDILIFCDRLQSYPLDSKALPLLASGYLDDSGRLNPLLLSIAVRPIGGSGKLALSCVVARDEGSSNQSFSRRAETWTTIGYNDADRLAHLLRTLVAGSSDELTIEFEPVG